MRSKQNVEEKSVDDGTVGTLDHEFANVFKALFPEIQCGHCYAQMRLLFIAGILTSIRAAEVLDSIEDAGGQREAIDWWMKQVGDVRQELEIELKVSDAIRQGHYHDETSSHH